MVAGVEAVTALVLIVKVALAAPARTVTLEGTLAATLLLESVTWAPPAGAGALSAIVPVEELPPVTVEGLSVSEERVGTGDGEDEGCSKITTAGFGSFIETDTNFDVEMAYTTALPPDPEVTVMVPRPFVGDEDIE